MTAGVSRSSSGEADATPIRSKDRRVLTNDGDILELENSRQEENREDNSHSRWGFEALKAKSGPGPDRPN